MVVFFNVISGLYTIVDYFAIFVIFSLFLDNWFCYFECDIFLSGYQWVEIAENWEVLVASAKTKFLSLFPGSTQQFAISHYLKSSMRRKMNIDFEASTCCLCDIDDSQLVTTGRDYEYGIVLQDLYMVKCNRCGTYYLNPRPTTASLSSIYPKDYYSYGEFTRKASIITRKVFHSPQAPRSCICAPSTVPGQC